MVLEVADWPPSENAYKYPLAIGQRSYSDYRDYYRTRREAATLWRYEGTVRVLLTGASI